MGLARKAAEAFERKRRRPESKETGGIDAVRKIGKETAKSVYRVNLQHFTPGMKKDYGARSQRKWL